MGIVPPYSEEEKEKLFTEICDGISEGKSLRQMCREKDISRGSFRKWREEKEDRMTQYVRATKERADYYFEEMIEIAYKPEYGKKKKVIKENGEGKKVEVIRGDMIEHRRLKVDTLKWALARMQPKKYGTKVDHTTDGEKFSGNIVINSQGVIPEVTEGSGGKIEQNEETQEEEETQED